MTSRGGWWARRRAEERQQWVRRPWMWQLYVFLCCIFAWNGVQGARRGDEWAAWILVPVAVWMAGTAVLAYRTAHPPVPAEGRDDVTADRG